MTNRLQSLVEDEPEENRLASLDKPERNRLASLDTPEVNRLAPLEFGYGQPAVAAALPVGPPGALDLTEGLSGTAPWQGGPQPQLAYGVMNAPAIQRDAELEHAQQTARVLAEPEARSVLGKIADQVERGYVDLGTNEIEFIQLATGQIAGGKGALQGWTPGKIESQKVYQALKDELRPVKPEPDTGAVGQLVGRGVFGAARMAPAMLYGGVAAAGAPMGGTAFWVTQIWPDRRRQLLAAGMEPVQANIFALGAAVAEAVIEDLQVRQMMPTGLAAGALKAFRQAYAKSVMGQIVKSAGKAAVVLGKEWSEEVAQKAVELGTQAAASYASRASGRPLDIDFEGQMRAGVSELVDAGLSIPVLMAFGQGVDVTTAVGGARQVQKARAQAERRASRIDRALEGRAARGVSQLQMGAAPAGVVSPKAVSYPVPEIVPAETVRLPGAEVEVRAGRIVPRGGQYGTEGKGRVAREEPQGQEPGGPLPVEGEGREAPGPGGALQTPGQVIEVGDFIQGERGRGWAEKFVDLGEGKRGWIVQAGMGKLFIDEKEARLVRKRKPQPPPPGVAPQPAAAEAPAPGAAELGPPDHISRRPGRAEAKAEKQPWEMTPEEHAHWDLDRRVARGEHGTKAVQEGRAPFRYDAEGNVLFTRAQGEDVLVLTGARANLKEGMERRERINAELFDNVNAAQASPLGGGHPLALPEGYVREGEFYVYRAPAAGRQVRGGGAAYQVGEARQRGRISAGEARLLRYLLKVAPDFDENSRLEILSSVMEATPEILAAEGIVPRPGVKYEVHGVTEAKLQAGVLQTTVRLLQGADAETAVHEFLERFWRRLPAAEQRRVEQWHAATQDPRRVSEHFSDEGAVFIFSKKLHERVGPIRHLFERARASLRALLARIRTFRATAHPIWLEDLWRQAFGAEAPPSREIQPPGPATPPFEQRTQGRLWPSYQVRAEEADFAPVFYSKLLRVLEEKMGERARPDEVMRMVQNAGVKEEEIFWTELGSSLGKLTRDGMVSKDELLTAMRQNEIIVDELEKYEKPPKEKDFAWYEEHPGVWRTDSIDIPVEVVEKGRGRYELRPYGELDQIAAWRITAYNVSHAWDQAAHWMVQFWEETAAEAPEDRRVQYPEYTLMGAGPHYTELLLRVDEAMDYEQPHWTEQGVVAHVRFDRTTDEAGRQVLFIEEIQSDLHQQGREDGYIVKSRPEEWTVVERSPGLWTPHALARAGRYAYIVRHPTNGTLTVYADTDAEAQEKAARQMTARQVGGVPDAPFRHTWPELCLKRMIRWAAENDYDMVAWTTGAQQNQRWGQTYRGNMIEASRTREGVYRVELYQSAGERYRTGAPNALVQSWSFPSRQALVAGLGGQLGPEVLQAIESDPTHTIVIEREGIEVGAGGLAEFYDKVLVNTARKLVKRFGGKVLLTKVSSGAPAWGFPLTPAMKDSALRVGFPSFQVRQAGLFGQEPEKERPAEAAGPVDLFGRPIAERRRRPARPGEPAPSLFAGGLEETEPGPIVEEKRETLFGGEEAPRHLGKERKALLRQAERELRERGDDETARMVRQLASMKGQISDDLDVAAENFYNDRRAGVGRATTLLYNAARALADKWQKLRPADLGFAEAPRSAAPEAEGEVAAWLGAREREAGRKRAEAQVEKEEPLPPQVAAAQAARAEVEGKEPWEMTRAEWESGRVRHPWRSDRGTHPVRKWLYYGVDAKGGKVEHSDVLQKALRDGESVPREVLLEYRAQPWAQERLSQIAEREMFDEFVRKEMEQGGNSATAKNLARRYLQPAAAALAKRPWQRIEVLARKLQPRKAESRAFLTRLVAQDMRDYFAVMWDARGEAYFALRDAPPKRGLLAEPPTAEAAEQAAESEAVAQDRREFMEKLARWEREEQEPPAPEGEAPNEYGAFTRSEKIHIRLPKSYRTEVTLRVVKGYKDRRWHWGVELEQHYGSHSGALMGPSSRDEGYETRDEAVAAAAQEALEWARDQAARGEQHAPNVAAAIEKWLGLAGGESLPGFQVREAGGELPLEPAPKTPAAPAETDQEAAETAARRAPIEQIVEDLARLLEPPREVSVQTRASMVREAEQEILKNWSYREMLVGAEGAGEGVGGIEGINAHTRYRIGIPEWKGEVMQFVGRPGEKGGRQYLWRHIIRSDRAVGTEKGWDETLDAMGRGGESIETFLELLDQVVTAKRKYGNVNAYALDQALEMGDAGLEFAWAKYSGLKEGYTLEEINSTLVDVAMEQGATEADIESSLLRPSTKTRTKRTFITESLRAKVLAAVRKAGQAGESVAREQLQKKVRDARRALAHVRSDFKQAEEFIRKEAAQDAAAKVRKQFMDEKVRQKELRAALAEFLKKHVGTKTRGRLLPHLDKVTTKKGLEKVMTLGQKMAEQEQARDLRGLIQRELARGKPRSGERGYLQGRRTADVEEKLEDIRAHRNDDRDQVRASIDAAIEAYESPQGGTPASYDDMMDKIERMKLWGTNQMTAEEAAWALEEIRHIKRSGLGLAEAKRQLARENTERNAEVAVGVITEGKGLKPGAGTIPRAQREAQRTWLDKFLNAQYGWDELIEKLSQRERGHKPYEGALFELTNVIHDARTEQARGTMDVFKEVRVGLEVVFGTQDTGELNRILNTMEMVELDLGEFVNARGELVRLKLTAEQMLKKWEEMHDPTLTETLMHPRGNALTPKMLKAIEGGLSDEEKAWGRWQLAFYQRYYHGVNAVWRDMNGVNLPHNRHYSPISRDVEAGIPENVLMGQETSRYAAVTSRSLKTRVPNLHPLMYTSATGTLVNHILQMEHYRAFAVPVREMRRLFQHRDVREAIRQYRGADVLAKVDDFLNDIARDGVTRARSVFVLDWLRRNAIKALLGFKPVIAAKQVPSVLAYMLEMPAGRFFQGVADFWRAPLDHYRHLIEGSPLIAERFRAGFERDIRAALAGRGRRRAARVASGKGSVEDLYLLLTRQGDQLAVMQGAWAAYRYALKTGKSEAQAWRFAERVTERTQPTSNVETLSSLQRGGSWAKMFTMFQSQLNKYFRSEATYARALRYGRGSRVKALSNLILVWVVLPSLFQLLADGLKYRPRRQLRPLILGPLNNVLVFGQLAQTIFDRLLKEPWGYQASPLFASVDDLLKAASSARRAVERGGNVLDMVQSADFILALERAAEGFGKIAGVPTPYFVQAERAIRRGKPLELIWTKGALEEEPETAGRGRRGRGSRSR
ncbi:MAG TPA: hypothetical protein VMY87_06210 [Armatimonadota bacterium]|nr:hypothetical protein [Armatimonadota bacterium]